MTVGSAEPVRSDAAPPPRPGRRDAIGHLVGHHRIAEHAAFSRPPAFRNSALAGFQAAATIALSLPVVELSPWRHLIGFAALGALVALFGRFAPPGRRGRIVGLAALCQLTAVGIMSASSWLQASQPVVLLVLAVAAGAYVFMSVTARLGPPGAVIFVFAAGASMAPVSSVAEIVERLLATSAVAALAWVVCAATESWRGAASQPTVGVADHDRPLSHRLVVAARIALASALAGFIGHAAGAAHPAWAVMGVIIVMQGPHLHINRDRAVQRALGTALGALLVWLIARMEPSVWSVIALVVTFQFLIELVVASNYVLAQVMVTPMALLMSGLATPHISAASMIPERILDTLLGVTVGIVVAVLLSSIDDRLHLARLHADRNTGR